MRVGKAMILWKIKYVLDTFHKYKTIQKSHLTNRKLLTNPCPPIWLLLQIDCPGHWPLRPQEPICTPASQVQCLFASYWVTIGIGDTKYPVEASGSWLING